MPEPWPPDPPAEQRSLRDRIQQVLDRYAGVATYRHKDWFGAGDHGGWVAGWGTTIEPRRNGKRIMVWYDAFDEDIAVYTEGHGRRRKQRGVWCEWQDLSDLPRVLEGVEAVLHRLLAEYTWVPPLEAGREYLELTPPPD